jgi:hypothetical protein
LIWVGATNQLDFNTPESIADSLKEVDKLFVLTPTHPKMVDFTTNLMSAAKYVKHIVMVEAGLIFNLLFLTQNFINWETPQ